MLNKMPQEIRTVAIVGRRVIGMGWTALFLLRGLKVIVSDPVEGVKGALERCLDQASPFFEERGNFEQLVTNYEFLNDIVPRLAEVDFVQEVNLSCTKIWKMCTLWKIEPLILTFPTERTRAPRVQERTYEIAG